MAENGVEHLRGLDGDYVDRLQLCIDPSCFTAADLSKSFEIGDLFDLAICVEVGEHLPQAHSEQFVRTLCRAAPVVLFSAAVPGQGGTGHINEQWPEYWARLFHLCGFHLCDSIRPRIRDDRRVRWWHRQNLVLYVSGRALEAHPILRSSLADSPIEWVHVNMLRQAGLRNLFRHLRPALVSAIRQRMQSYARQTAKQESNWPDVL
jgi:hypothetical protein